MSFGVIENTDTPTATTVASYTLERLGQYPTVRIRFTETRDGGTNVFGQAAQRQAGTGRTWELSLHSEDPEQMARMVDILGKVSFIHAREILTVLGITTVSDEQLAAAVGQVENIDSVIATQLEDVEKDRRAGTLHVNSFCQAAP